MSEEEAAASPMLQRAELAVREPFVGVATSAGRLEGLFAIGETGVSTAQLYERATRFLDQLAPTRREGVRFPLESDAWRRWSNIHRFVMRHGTLLDGCTTAERELALELVASALSDDGFHTVRRVMQLNETLQELSGRPDEFGEWLYWISCFGTPDAREPWGFQFDGHHVNLNCLVLGDQIVVSPLFLGSEPVVASAGRYEGTSVFRAEESAGSAMLASLSIDERKTAIIADELPREMFTAAFRDNVVLDYAGIAHDALSEVARRRLLELIAVYTNRIRPGHAEVKMAEILDHLDETYFCWMGGTAPEDVLYYRVHSPVILIEFDHQSGVVYDNDYPTRRHIHTVVRTPNGNDYGKDLLRQHYEDQPHPR